MAFEDTTSDMAALERGAQGAQHRQFEPLDSNLYERRPSERAKVMNFLGRSEPNPLYRSASVVPCGNEARSPFVVVRNRQVEVPRHLANSDRKYLVSAWSQNTQI